MLADTQKFVDYWESMIFLNFVFISAKIICFGVVVSLIDCHSAGLMCNFHSDQNAHLCVFFSHLKDFVKKTHCRRLQTYFI